MATRSTAAFRVDSEDEASAGGGAELVTAALALASLACREASTRARRWAAEVVADTLEVVAAAAVAVAAFSAAANL